MSPQKKRKAKQSTQSKQAAALQSSRREQADRLMDQAFETDDPDQQVALALEALEISADCAEAYLLLADDAANAEQALQLLEQGVAAAARVIGEDGFREYAGEFWGFIETRPYMRARLGLADCLLDMGRVEDAIEHYREMLELNPNDNQGIRYRLAAVLAESDRLDELESLLKTYEDDYSADWVYTRALLTFKREGDTETARNQLMAAEQMNSHVPSYLTGTKPLPRELPEYISLGEESEAVSFVAGAMPAWRTTPGAIPWLRKTLNIKLLDHPPKRRPVSWKHAQEVLVELPQLEDSVWEIDLVRLLAGRTAESKAWALFLIDAQSAHQYLAQIWDERPSDSELWRLLLETMRKPDGAEPHRPRTIQLTRKTLFKSWSGKLEQVGIECELTDNLPQISLLVSEFDQMVSKNSGPAHTLPADDAELEQLPQAVGEVWSAAVCKLPTWIEVGGGEMRRPVVRLVLDTTNETILATDFQVEEPPEDWLREGIRSAICCPLVGDPQRPGVVQVPPEFPLYDLETWLESIGIRCVVAEDNRLFDEIIDEMTERVSGPRQLQSMVKTPGVKPEQLEGFYAAAADFYRAAPWRHIRGDSIIRVETDAFSSGPWYAVVMGQQGMELGITLYEDLELLHRILSGQFSDEENARKTSALSVTFGEIFDIAPEDADAIESHGWPVASEEAYPSILRVNPGLALRSPLPWEIELMEACLRSIPEFLQEKHGESSPTASTSTREITLRLKRLE